MIFIFILNYTLKFETFQKISTISQFSFDLIEKM